MDISPLSSQEIAEGKEELPSQNSEDMNTQSSDSSAKSNDSQRTIVHDYEPPAAKLVRTGAIGPGHDPSRVKQITPLKEPDTQELY